MYYKEKKERGKTSLYLMLWALGSGVTGLSLHRWSTSVKASWRRTETLSMTCWLKSSEQARLAGAPAAQAAAYCVTDTGRVELERKELLGNSTL